MAHFGVYLAILALSLASSSTQILHAGEIGLTSISSFMDWEPTDCSKPWQPSFSCYDKFSCATAIDEFNSYVAEVKSYINCIASEAESDVQTVSNAIADGLDEAQSEVTNEVDWARSDLESAISIAGFSLR